MKRRQLWSGIWAGAGILLLILDGQTAISGARSGLYLCLRTVLPSLLPFMLLSNLLVGSLSGLEISILKPLARFLRLPDGCSALLVPFYLGGYPLGAQAVADGWKQGRIDREPACRMLAFCSNAGPAFIMGMVSQVFPEPWMAWSLLGIHILSSLLVGRLMPSEPGAGQGTPVRIAAAPAHAMEASLKAMGLVCGWVICFQTISAVCGRHILHGLPVEIQTAVMGLLELTSGCSMLPLIQSLELRYLMAAVLLGLGGLCVTMQTASILHGLPLSAYLRGKSLQAVFSFILAGAVMAGPFPAVLAAAGLYLLISLKQKRNSGIYAADAV